MFVLQANTGELMLSILFNPYLIFSDQYNFRYIVHNVPLIQKCSFQCFFYYSYSRQSHVFEDSFCSRTVCFSLSFESHCNARKF